MRRKRDIEKKPARANQFATSNQIVIALFYFMFRSDVDEYRNIHKSNKHCDEFNLIMHSSRLIGSSTNVSD